MMISVIDGTWKLELLSSGTKQQYQQLYEKELRIIEERERERERENKKKEIKRPPGEGQ